MWRIVAIAPPSSPLKSDMGAETQETESAEGLIQLFITGLRQELLYCLLNMLH